MHCKKNPNPKHGFCVLFKTRVVTQSRWFTNASRGLVGPEVRGPEHVRPLFPGNHFRLRLCTVSVYRYLDDKKLVSYNNLGSELGLR